MDALTPGMHEMTVDGVRQVYHVAGSGPICIVHPGGPGFHWEYLRMPLLETFMTLVYLEPIGTGQSGLLLDGDYSASRYAGFARKVAQHIGSERPYFLGHSHGAFVGLQYALDYPDELGGLIVYDGAPVTGPEHGMEATRGMELFAQRWPERTEAQEAKQAWMDVATGAVSLGDRESFLGVLQRLLPAYFGDYRNLPEEFANWKANLDATIDPNRKPELWDIRQAMSSIRIPTLVLVGEYDFICGPRWAEEMHEAIPGSRLVILERSGHMSHVEKPREFADSIREFVSYR
jgi:proline iminopeptidase